MILLVVLQNAYKKGDLKSGFRPATWKKEYLSSRTGRRLKSALPRSSSWKIHFTNASPVLGEDVDANHVPCEKHLMRVLKRIRPDIVLACGLNAEQCVLRVWTGPLVTIPHPAYRLLTDMLLDDARKCIEDFRIFSEHPAWRPNFAKTSHMTVDNPRIKIVQKRNAIEQQLLEGHR